MHKHKEEEAKTQMLTCWSSGGNNINKHILLSLASERIASETRQRNEMVHE